MECGHMNDQLILLSLFVLFTLSFFVIAFSVAKKKRRNNRLTNFVPKREINKEEEKGKEKQAKSVLSTFSKVFNGIRFSKKTATILQQAGSELKLEEFFFIRLLVGSGMGLALVVSDIPIIYCVLLGYPGFMIPKMYMKNKAKKRLKSLTNQLVEALGTMSNSLRAGFSFLQTMQLIGKEMPDPIGPEFDRVVKEIGMGISMEDAFEDLLSRLPNKELEVVVQAILAQRKSGGNLADLLDTMEDTVRGRLRIYDEVKTLTAQGKLSSIIITVLPVLMGVYLYMVNPEYFGPMLHQPLGIAMLSIGAISLFIGWFLIQKIVKIEV